MICTDKLSEGIQRSSCLQDTLRGFTGSIIIQDWRGYNRFNPRNEYRDYVEIKAERLTIKPSYLTEVREDNISLFIHMLSFAVMNNQDDASKTLASLVNIPLIMSLELQGGGYLTLFKETGAKLNIIGEYSGANNGMTMFSCQHYHLDVKESLPPERDDLEDVLKYNVTFNIFDESSLRVEGATLSINDSSFISINGTIEDKLINGIYPYSVALNGYNTHYGVLVVDGKDVVEDINLSLKIILEHTITFKITHSNLVPLRDAIVTINEESKVTGTNGEAIFEIDEGAYSYSVSHLTKPTENGTVVINGDEVVEVYMEEPPLYIYGYLYNAHTFLGIKELTSSNAWRVGSYSDWLDLKSTPGGANGLKSIRRPPMNQPRWELPVVANNFAYRFGANPGGIRQDPIYDFTKKGINCFFWSPEDLIGGDLKFASFINSSASMSLETNGVLDPNCGLSIRLCRNATVSERSLPHGTIMGNYVGNDGSIYGTVKAGDLVWTTRNLEETKYRDGSTIPTVTDGVEWANLTTGAKCAYDNNELLV